MADIKTTVGGKRIGSGKKMQVEMHGYTRSNHDLSMINRLSMAPGALTPIYTNIAQTGDDWEFKLDAIVRTLPTQMALYGTFTLQVHFFVCPIRLYNAVLHNNAINLGNNMATVVYPSGGVPITTPVRMTTETPNWNSWDWQKQNMNPSALLAHLGICNPGSCKAPANRYSQNITYRFFNMAPFIAYWDIFKNFYANTQEELAYYIGVEEIAGKPGPVQGLLDSVYFNDNTVSTSAWAGTVLNDTRETAKYGRGHKWEFNIGETNSENNGMWRIKTDGTPQAIYARLYRYSSPNDNDISAQDLSSICDISTSEDYPGATIYMLNKEKCRNQIPLGFANNDWTRILVKEIRVLTKSTATAGQLKGMNLVSFPLKNLDKGRGYILKNFFEGENVILSNNQSASGYSNINFEPYNSVFKIGERKQTDDDNNNTQYREFLPHNHFSKNGIALRTYLNDIFTNWLDTDTIKKIEQTTAATITNGQLSISALILAERMYNHKNRVEMNGGTYEDWKEAVYGIKQDRMSEMPMFIGGMSSEIVFDEVVSTSETTNSDGSVNPLGSLGGRGTLRDKNGGHFEMKFTEDCYIIGIASIVPRIDYSQGNKWFMSLQNNDQLHKPELDAIGFQNLVGDWMNGADTQVPLPTSNEYEANKWGATQVYAKQPAWIHYMTAVNEAHGDFADEDKSMFMTLNRRFEIENDASGTPSGIKDFTSYIDPRKYNYAFADTTIESENFWVQIGVYVEPRRVMSAKIMPNL